MNFFDYVKLIQLGWDPAPPEEDWPKIKAALKELANVNRGAMQIAEAVRIEEYIEKVDKEIANVDNVERTSEG